MCFARTSLSILINLYKNLRSFCVHSMTWRTSHVRVQATAQDCAACSLLLMPHTFAPRSLIFWFC